MVQTTSSSLRASGAPMRGAPQNSACLQSENQQWRAIVAAPSFHLRSANIGLSEITRSGPEKNIMRSFRHTLSACLLLFMPADGIPARAQVSLLPAEVQQT